MSPEQRLGELTPAADVYAAGVILVELLSGTPALASWLGDRAALLRGARWNRQLPASAEAVLGDRAPKIRALLESLFAPDATQRPTALEAAAELRALALPDR